MKKSYRRLNIILSFILFLPAFLLAGWYKIHEDPSFVTFHAAYSYMYDLSIVYAAGPNGWIYSSYDQGKNWSAHQALPGHDLYGIGNGQTQDSSFIFFCGAKGALVRYDNQQDVWHTFNFTRKNLNAIDDNYYRNEIWVVGDSNYIAISRDALTWEPLSIQGPVMDIKAFFVTYQNTILLGNDRANIYIHYLKSEPDSEVTEDFTTTLENYQLINIAKGSGEANGDIYFLAKETHTQEIHLMSFNIYNTPLSIDDLGIVPFENVLALGMYSNYNTTTQYFWISSQMGEIWESSRPTNFGTLGTWKIVYREPNGRSIHAFLSSEQDNLRGMALGEQGLVLLNSFQIKEITPPVENVISYPENTIRIKFSTVPDINLLRSNSFAFSNYSGLLSFNITYDSSDSTYALYQLNRAQPLNAIPGETWSFGFGPNIYALHDTVDPLALKQTQFSYTFSQMRPSDFSYTTGPYVRPIKRPSTNWASGFFNQDDLLDLVTMSSDSLYCYYRVKVATDSIINRLTIISFPQLISLSKPIHHQLITANINNDNLPDLIVYDQNAVHFLINESNGNNINFVLASNFYQGRNIRQVVAYNDDNNAQTDLLVLGSSLELVYNIFPGVNQFNSTTLFYDASNIEKIAVGNVDDDPANDLVMAENGRILYRKGSAQYGLSYGEDVDTLTSGTPYYYDVKLANLDNDNKLDIVALYSQGIDIIPIYKDIEIGRAKNVPAQPNSIVQFNPNAGAPSDFIIQDFGGNPETDVINALDIAVLQNDSLFIYQNQTSQTENFMFSNAPVFKMSLGSGYNPYDRLTCCDYDADGTLNILASDYETGSLLILQKLSWKPHLQVTTFDAHHVQLQWDSPPSEFGEPSYYRIIKTFKNSTETTIDVHSNSYTDFEVWSYQDYTYHVQAFFSDQQQSQMSNPVYVHTYYELNEVVTGVLADTTLPYWAKSNLLVPQGDSLLIMPGIYIEFDSSTGLDIEGKFAILGDSSHMVELSAHDSLWNGVNLFSNPDTVNMYWFSISNARTAIQSNGRPFNIRLCGIVASQTGIQVTNSNFFIENSIIDSCMLGIMAGENTSGYLKNIDLMHTQNHSLFAQGQNSILHVRNAIIWGNMQPISAIDPARIRIRYSTIDSLGDGVITEHISHLPPLFRSNADDEDMPYLIDPMSPTVDAGDPQDVFALEPEPNGGRINQGLYGNLPYAAPSLQPRSRIFALRTHLRALPKQQDSTMVFIKNFGYAPLEVDNIQWLHSNEAGPFISEAIQTTDGISPQDSIGFKIWFTPPQRGYFSDSLILTCNDPHLENGRVFLAVDGQGLNSKPQILNNPPTEAYVDSPYVYVPDITDADGDSVAVTPLQKPAWLTWSNGSLSGTPALSDTGANPVSLKFDDLFGGVDTLRFVIDVKRSGAHLVIHPVLTVSPIGGLTSLQAAMRLHISVSDSTKDWVKEATDSYHMRIRLFRLGSEDTLRMDTTGVKELTFTHLIDGIYTVNILAFKRVNEKLLMQKSTVNFTIKASAKTTNRFLWLMVSLPRNRTFNMETLNIKDSSAVLFRWNTQTEKYDLLNGADLLPGTSFWVMPLKFLHINLNPFPIQTNNNEAGAVSPAQIQLKPGWNQVGLSLPYFERWIDCQIFKNNEEISWNQAFEDSLISPAVYWFEQSNDFIGYHPQAIDSTTVAIPWRGYWMYSTANLVLRLPDMPYFPQQDQALKKVSPLMKVKNDPDAALFNLTVACKNYKDDYNLFGIGSVKSAKLPEPPSFKDFASVSFEENGRSYCKSVKQLPNDALSAVSWNVTLRTSNPDKPHHLQWSQLSFSQEPVYLYLVDPQCETVINMNEKFEYDLTPGKSIYKLKIYASHDDHFKPAIIPLQYKLAQNYPNPFNPTTTIRVGIPEDGKSRHITLKIYNVLGKIVKTLVDGTLQPGYHKFEWDGKNDQGNTVSSGIYFYRLQAGPTSIMHKMILLR